MDGAANEGLCQFLAQLLGTRKTDVIILRGAKSRKKTVSLLGDSELLLNKLLAELQSS